MSALDNIRSRRAMPWPSDTQKMIQALDAVTELIEYWETLADGDKYYAARIRAAIESALEAGK